MYKSILLVLIVALSVGLSILAKQGVVPLNSYGSFLNALLPPKLTAFPIATSTIWEPTKKITLPVTHPLPSSYAVYLLLPKGSLNNKFHDIGPVETLLQHPNTKDVLYKINSSPTLTFIDGMIGKKIASYSFPHHTKSLKTCQLQISLQNDLSEILAENEKIICTVYTDPKPPLKK